MMRNAKFATWVVSGYLVAYCLLLGLGSGFWRAFAVGMFFCSPVFVVWLAWTVVRWGKADGKELGADAEFGYADRDTARLGIW